MFKFFELISEVINWLLIASSPLFLGLGIGALVYFPNPNVTRLVIGISIASLGLVVGVIWATKIWKTKGTVWYMSRIMATPDFDNTNNGNKDNGNMNGKKRTEK